MAQVGLPSYDDVNSAYQQNLGRGASQDEYQQYWANRPDYQQGIASSGEAQAYKQKSTTQSAPSYTQPSPPPYGTPVNSSVPGGPQQQSSADPSTAIQQYYQQYLGRAAGANDPQSWLSGAYGYGTDLPTIENAIRNSPEAQAYAKSRGGTSAPSAGGDPGAYLLQLLQSGMDRDSAIQQTGQTFNLPAGQDGYPLFYANNNTIGLKNSYLANVGGQWSQTLRGPEGQSSGGYGGTSVFSDPATANFEKLLNDTISRFNTPATPPDYQASLDQLKAYLAKLNGPVYTPAEMELQQTQALNPMQQQQDAARQQLIARMGSQGIGPNSGITEKALEDLNRQFEQARTTTQANFATQAIGASRQNAAAAAALAPQISGLEQQQTQWQDQRAQQAATLAAFIPQMAQQRLQAANGSIQQLNPSLLFNALQGFQQQGYNQSANYSSQLSQLLATLFGLGGGQ